MKQKFRLTQLLILPLLMLSLAVIGCDDDSGTSPVVDNGFEASVSDFANFTNWDAIDYTVYPTFSDKLGPAHAGNDSSVVRVRYKNSDAVVANGEYARGSVVVKETFKWVNGQKTPVAEGGFLGMAKRDGDFNPDKGGWEYFNLGDGTEIAARGTDDLMGGACQNCHTAASGNNGMDYIFNFPSEYVVAAGSEWDDLFMNAGSWELLDSRQGADPLLGGAHGDGVMKRDTYRWQPAAMYHDGKFPIGTVIAKEVYEEDDQGNKSNITWTAMVKRGGDFNPNYGNWEWFMITDPMDEQNRAVNRGGDLMNNMCNGCHSTASSNSGGDYVFGHPNLGF